MSETNYKVISQSGHELTNTEHPLHPGYVIDMEIDARGMKKQDVAKSLGILPGHLSEMLKEKRHVSAMIALRLEDLFGIDADFWLRIQNGYDLVKAREKLKQPQEGTNIIVK